MVGAIVLSASANAALLEGIFNMDVYQGNGGGSISHDNAQANAANPLIHLDNQLYTGTYTGQINFNTVESSNNILESPPSRVSLRT